LAVRLREDRFTTFLLRLLLVLEVLAIVGTLAVVYFAIVRGDTQLQVSLLALLAFTAINRAIRRLE
jgi:hypothetical protein